MACDICGKPVGFAETLTERYATEDIKELCAPCMKAVNDHLWKLRAMSNKMNESFLKQFMQNLRHKFKG